MTVSDDEMEHLLRMRDQFSGGGEIARKVYSELLALRKVADAAAEMARADRFIDFHEAATRIEAALKAAGR